MIKGIICLSASLHVTLDMFLIDSVIIVISFSEHIYELYFCLPCTDEKPGKYVYPRFPELSRTVQYTKKAVVLQREAEHRRKHDTKNQLQAVDLVLSANTEKATRRSSIGFMRKESMMEFTIQEGESNFKTMMKAVLKIQAVWKTSVVRKRYSYKKAATLKFNATSHSLDKHGTSIQKLVRGFLSRVRYLKFKAATIMQTVVRRFTKRKRFQRVCRMVLKLQAYYRMRVVKKSYRKTISCVTKFKAAYRGRLTFRQIEMYRKQSIVKLRTIIFQLWMLSNTSLEYRSEFWKCVDEMNFLHLSLLIAEVKKLWLQLKYDRALLKKLSYPEIFTSVNSLENYVQSKIENGIPESPDIVQERKKFYTLMKSGIKDETHQKKYFEGFDITKRKKRKRDLTKRLLWVSQETADISAKVVLDLLDIEVDKSVWINKHKSGLPGAYSMVRVVQEFMQTQQKLNTQIL